MFIFSDMYILLQKVFAVDYIKRENIIEIVVFLFLFVVHLLTKVYAMSSVSMTYKHL